MASVSTTPLFDDLANSIHIRRYESTRKTGKPEPLEVYVEEDYYLSLLLEIENKRELSNLTVELLNYGTLYGVPFYQVRKVKTYATQTGVPIQSHVRNPPKYRIISGIRN